MATLIAILIGIFMVLFAAGILMLIGKLASAFVRLISTPERNAQR